MDPGLHNAIAHGNFQMLKEIDVELLFQTTVALNTTLHVAVEYERKECVEEILQECPSLLWSKNMNGDTALHIAARQGLHSVTDLLLVYNDKTVHDQQAVLESGGAMEGSRQLLRIRNKDGDTALHEATRNDHVEVVGLLIEADQDCEYIANVAGETPLFLAAKNGNDPSMVEHILQTWPYAADGGPNGMTALHAAAMTNKLDIVMMLLEKESAVIRRADYDGWTALHYAAYSGNFEVIDNLLEFDCSLGYLQDQNGMSPLHIAVSKGHLLELFQFVDGCPDSQELLDNKGRNFFHIATMRGPTFLVQEILERTTISKAIINQPDNDGNTPLHLAAIYTKYEILICLSGDSRVRCNAMNKENLTAFSIINKIKSEDKFEAGDEYWQVWTSLGEKSGFDSRLEKVSQEPDTLSQYDEKMRKMRRTRKENVTQQIQRVSNSHLVVATLIATVTFAAGFALPGGYRNDEPDEGAATLLRDRFFEAFALSNTLAMLFSSLAVVIHFLMKLVDDKEITSSLLISAFLCTFAAIFAMMLAFVTGTYAVLAHSPVLAFTTGIIGCTFYFSCFFLLGKYYKKIKFPF